MSAAVPFQAVARLAEPGDNVAIAIVHLRAGAEIAGGNGIIRLSHDILEGHRFAVRPISTGEPLLSWSLPFGVALIPIAAGDYICNTTMLEALQVRQIRFTLPSEPNFKNHSIANRFAPETFTPGVQVPPHRHPGTFRGFVRPGQRGVGTRNYIAVLGTTSQTAAYARALAGRFRDVPARYSNIDGVVALAHTEGGGSSIPNNIDFLLRTLAGFAVHPNIGAMLIADTEGTPVNNQLLRKFLEKENYPAADVPHRFLSVKGGHEAALRDGAAVVEAWLETVNNCRRSAQPLSRLKIALQCGGSDAFSGVSGNPLAGWVAKELIRHGGSANLGETSELIGAEPYVLANVRDLDTARTFLDQTDRFERWANWHGHSAEGNPSGGNLYRGLYNITIKSIGAARKKDPEVRLDYAIDFARPMTEPGFYFMDSPGNDLECIAGQVASGCNMILFITGNGSITNFPFVPTLKIVTTTGRYNLLKQDMDINAGRYLDGTPLESLGRESFNLTVETASGKRSVGELAGHYQVQLWREWRQTGPDTLLRSQSRPQPSGTAVPLSALAPPPEAARFRKFRIESGTAADQVGLIAPTSLCSGQVARIIAERLSQNPPPAVSRFVALAHTEGCGVARGESERLLKQTLTGYLCHPFVRKALLLEHGCEKTHNDEITAFLRSHRVDPNRFGYASVQLDGGIDRVCSKVIDWFRSALADQGPAPMIDVGLECLRLGLFAQAPPEAGLAHALGSLARTIVSAGGTVVIPAQTALVDSMPFRGALQPTAALQPTIDYGQPVTGPGLHVMAIPTDHEGEILTGMGATGVELFLASIATHSLQAHPMIPMLQTATDNRVADVDLHFRDQTHDVILNLILRTLGKDYCPRLVALQNTDFQITRGLVGVSL